jgi:hypothetical protein
MTRVRMVEPHDEELESAIGGQVEALAELVAVRVVAMLLDLGIAQKLAPAQPNVDKSPPGNKPAKQGLLVAPKPRSSVKRFTEEVEPKVERRGRPKGTGAEKASRLMRIGEKVLIELSDGKPHGTISLALALNMDTDDKAELRALSQAIALHVNAGRIEAAGNTRGRVYQMAAKR